VLRAVARLPGRRGRGDGDRGAADQPAARGLVCDLIGEPTFVPHEEFKRASAIAGAFDRTGEASPFANVIVHSAVPF